MCRCVAFIGVRWIFRGIFLNWGQLCMLLECQSNSYQKVTGNGKTLMWIILWSVGQWAFRETNKQTKWPVSVYCRTGSSIISEGHNIIFHNTRDVIWANCIFRQADNFRKITTEILITHLKQECPLLRSFCSNPTNCQTPNNNRELKWMQFVHSPSTWVQKIVFFGHF